MSQNMKMGQVIIFLNSETNNMNKEFIPYQQAFRWFREKHNTTHEILRKEDKNHREFIAWVYVENDKIEVVSYWNALTYEEAELACLKKLIEVVKTK